MILLRGDFKMRSGRISHGASFKWPRLVTGLFAARPREGVQVNGHSDLRCKVSLYHGMSLCCVKLYQVKSAPAGAPTEPTHMGSRAR